MQEYHTGERDRKVYDARYRGQNEAHRQIIVWDGEGIKLAGKNRPQSYVLFGCSAEPHTPLIIRSKRQELGFEELADYMCDVAARYPDAKHMGYFFGYDQNMIIKSLPWSVKQRIHEHGWVTYRTTDTTYKINVKFGKQIWIVRERGSKRSSIRIDDIGPFFASSFVKAYESMFPDHADDPTWSIVTSGKLARGNTTWTDLPIVRQYWEIEIEALRRLAVFFRDLMFKAGFGLTEWYGPGALARKIRAINSLARHEYGGKEPNLPGGVHTACKYAFFGGHFEQYVLGRINRTVYGLDIRSAYPFAFTKVPSLREGGFWQEVDTPSDDPDTFGVYHLRYEAPNAIGKSGYPRRGHHAPQPLPWRNERDEVVYSTVVEGWYWRPEMDMVTELYPECVQVFSGWEWRAISDERPWRDVLLPMFAARRELKEIGDPCQMAFKLGPNSLYGKMAQRTGWDTTTNSPPRSHTLCIAGFITSYCRALIMRVIAQIPDGDVIAVETDGIYTTVPPENLSLPNGIGNELGQWDVEQYDEMLYVQNGLYLGRVGPKWTKKKTRGIRSDQIQPDTMGAYLASLRAGWHWPKLKLSAGERFTGLGAAISRGKNASGQLVPPKASALHCRWTPDEREVIPGGRGKRSHAARYCPACKAGKSCYDGEHRLMVSTPSAIKFGLDGATGRAPFNAHSHPYTLPWEADSHEPYWLENDAVSASLLTGEDLTDRGIA